MRKRNEIFNKVSEECDINYQDVKYLYNMVWKVIRDHIASIPLKDINDLDEFSKYKININLPKLGKLICDYNRFKKLRNKYDNKKDKTIIYNNSNNNE